MGEAVVEHGAAQVEIRTDFPLYRVPGRALPRGEASSEPSSVNAPRKRMSLRAVLHLLYHRAGLNRWYPAMEGRRSQGVLEKYLELAAAGLTLKGETLDQRLYVPEPFRVADKEAIAERRRRKLALLLSPGEDVAYKMAIVVGQFNGAEPTAYGRRIAVKHMPDAPLYVDDKAWQRAERAYAATLQARDADLERKPIVLMAALVYARCEHLYQVDTLTMMLVSDQWVPLEGLHELPLVEELQRQGRSFLEPLRFDARSAAAFPNALLLDTVGAPVPLHILSPFLDPKEQRAKEKALQALGERAWVWRTDQPLPEFPARAVARSQGVASQASGQTAPVAGRASSIEPRALGWLDGARRREGAHPPVHGRTARGHPRFQVAPGADGDDRQRRPHTRALPRRGRACRQRRPPGRRRGRHRHRQVLRCAGARTRHGPVTVEAAGREHVDRGAAAPVRRQGHDCAAAVAAGALHLRGCEGSAALRLHREADDRGAAGEPARAGGRRALVLAAIAMDGASVLPAAEETIFVFDEAHSLGAKAVEHFSARHALLGAVEWLEGAVNAVRDAVLGLRLDAELLGGSVDRARHIEQALRELHRRIDATRGFDDKRARRFRGGVLPPWCRSAGEQILASGEALQKTFALLREHVLEQAASAGTLTTQIVSVLGFYAVRLDNLVDTWRLMLAPLDDDAPPIARWIERHDAAGRAGDYLVCAAPISASDSVLPANLHEMTPQAR